MKGLELSKAFFEEWGLPMLKEQFPELLPQLAIGLVGCGSECFGYDDEISRDHDFEPGFCIFLPDNVDRQTEFLLERAYAKLPKTFRGFDRCPQDPVGGNRHGVLRMGDFLEGKTGSRDGLLTLQQWLTLPEQSLLEATNGELFLDKSGIFTRIRDHLSYFPEDIRRKRLAGHLLLMGQAGQYNYPRCLARSDTGAAQLAAIEFARSAMHAAFLLEGRYLPYYKWQFKALESFDPELAERLETLISTAGNKTAQIETLCGCFVTRLRSLTSSTASELEQQAYLLNDTITDGQVRNLHILSGI